LRQAQLDGLDRVLLGADVRAVSRGRNHQRRLQPRVGIRAMIEEQRHDVEAAQLGLPAAFRAGLLNLAPG
jgi:hypothetical protein